MTHLQGVVNRLAPDPVRFAYLGDVIELKFGARVTKRADSGSLYPVYGGGGESFRVDHFNRESDYVVSRFAMSAKCVRKVDGKFWLLDSGFTFEVVDGAVLKDYVAHFLFKMQPEIYACSSQGAQRNLKTEEFKRFKIPLPPLEVQREIVRNLQLFTEFEESLEAELAARAQQLVHYQRSLMRSTTPGGKPKPGWGIARVGDLCRVEKGKTAIQQAKPGHYPLVATSLERQSSAGYDFEGEAVCIPLVSSKGHGVASISRIFYQSGKFALGTILAAVIPNDAEVLLAEYLYRYLQTRTDTLLVPLMRGGANVSLTVESLNSVLIHVPPIDEQREIVEVLNTLNSLLDDRELGLPVELAARRKQHEYYRDKLLTFEEAPA